MFNVYETGPSFNTCSFHLRPSVNTYIGADKSLAFLNSPTFILRIILLFYTNNIYIILYTSDLCGIVVRVQDYSYRGPGFDSQNYQIF
jgi:hypothetical protein